MSEQQRILKEIDCRSTGRIKGGKGNTNHRENDFTKSESKREEDESRHEVRLSWVTEPMEQGSHSRKGCCLVFLHRVSQCEKKLGMGPTATGTSRGAERINSRQMKEHASTSSSDFPG